MSRPITQGGPSHPPPIQKRSQSVAAPAKKKGLSQGAFAKMALFHSEEQEELRPIRRKLPTRAGKWSDDDVSFNNSMSQPF
jgi:muconolactone delta-isomerase